METRYFSQDVVPYNFNIGLIAKIYRQLWIKHHKINKMAKLKSE